VKNTLAIVEAIIHQSLRSAESLEQGKKAIETRLAALGRVHDLLLRTGWNSVKLSELLRTAIEPFDTVGVGQFVICAPLAVGPSRECDRGGDGRS
jgi:two-component sensor histidine kinase